MNWRYVAYSSSFLLFGGIYVYTISTISGSIVFSVGLLLLIMFLGVLGWMTLSPQWLVTITWILFAISIGSYLFFGLLLYTLGAGN